MTWHGAQIGFVIATTLIVGGVVTLSAYIVSSVTWSDRWARRQVHVPPPDDMPR